MPKSWKKTTTPSVRNRLRQRRKRARPEDDDDPQTPRRDMRPAAKAQTPGESGTSAHVASPATAGSMFDFTDTVLSEDLVGALSHDSEFEDAGHGLGGLDEDDPMLYSVLSDELDSRLKSDPP